MKRVLLLGCGTSRERRIRVTEGGATDFSGDNVISVDMDPRCNPTYCWNMNDGFPKELVLYQDGMFDEIHAYDSLEHWGQQGDWKGWLDEMGSYHDLLKPGGLFFALVPVGEDRFADPGHVRFMGTNFFTVLSQEWYKDQAKKGIHGGDYRWYWKKDFKILHLQYSGDPPHHLAVVLEKV